MYYKLTRIPISSFIATILIIIFLLSFSTLLKIEPCNKDFLSSIVSNFLHMDIIHLIFNLYGLYILSRLEVEVGSTHFGIILVFIVLINTFIEILLHKLINLPCSIGFSGILYGILTYELISENKQVSYDIALIVIYDIIASRFDKRISLISHFIGVVSGILVGLLMKPEEKIEKRQRHSRDNFGYVS